MFSSGFLSLRLIAQFSWHAPRSWEIAVCARGIKKVLFEWDLSPLAVCYLLTHLDLACLLGTLWVAYPLLFRPPLCIGCMGNDGACTWGGRIVHTYAQVEIEEVLPTWKNKWANRCESERRMTDDVKSKLEYYFFLRKNREKDDTLFPAMLRFFVMRIPPRIVKELFESPHDFPLLSSRIFTPHALQFYTEKNFFIKERKMV